MLSISSMKMMLGACSLAITKSSRTQHHLHGDDAGCVFSGHHEEFPHHATSLSDKLLHQLGAGDPDEGALGVVSHSSGQQSLPSPGGTVEQDALGLGDTQGVKQLGVFHWQLDHLLDLLDLLVQSC